MSNFGKELNDLKDLESQLTVEMAKLEERLKTLKEEEARLNTQLKELGIENMEDLKSEIETLEEQIKAGIEKCKSQMNSNN